MTSDRTQANERPGLDTGWHLLFGLRRPRTRGTQGGRKPSCVHLLNDSPGGSGDRLPACPSRCDSDYRST